MIILYILDTNLGLFFASTLSPYTNSICLYPSLYKSVSILSQNQNMNSLSIANKRFDYKTFVPKTHFLYQYETEYHPSMTEFYLIPNI